MARLKQRAEAKENAAKRLKADLLAVMQATNIPKLDVGIAKLCVQQASRPSIRWLDESRPPPVGLAKVTVTLDGEAAYQAHKAGTLPDGFEVKHSKYLSIR